MKNDFRTYAKNIKAFLSQPHVRKILVVALVILSILAFYIGFLVHMSSTFKGGDFDQQSQYYEAARVSILHYHQFPFWNPWESGGMPLYNNPQYGLISIQSLTTLIFGTFAGLKIAYLIYVFIGFSGMYVFTKRVFGASTLRAILLSYVWIFCGFFSYHGIDHLGFSLMHFLPWLLYLFTLRHNDKTWIWFGLLISLMLLTSPHYAVLMCALCIFLLWLWQSVFIKPASKHLSVGLDITKADLLFFAKSGLLIFVLCAYRMIGAYDFIKTAPRVASDLYEPANSPFLMLYALFAPANKTGIPTSTHWSWGEYSGYIGLGAGLALLVVVSVIVRFIATRARQSSKGRKELMRYITTRNLVVFFVLLGILGFVLSLGDFSKISPMGILKQFPGFDQTRVASRWILISIFAIIVLLASWKKQTRIINILLALSVIELFAVFHTNTQFFAARTYVTRSYGTSFHQVINPRYDRLMGPGGQYSDKSLDSLYVNMLRNEGSIFTDDPLVNTTVSAPTVRCDSKLKGSCPFVISHNAKLVKWTPNNIVLQRTGKGTVEIDMNPGSYWLVNGARIPSTTNKSPARSGERFLINDKSNKLDLEIVPKYSLQNVWRIITN